MPWQKFEIIAVAICATLAATYGIIRNETLMRIAYIAVVLPFSMLFLGKAIFRAITVKELPTSRWKAPQFAALIELLFTLCFFYGMLIEAALVLRAVNGDIVSHDWPVVSMFAAFGLLMFVSGIRSSLYVIHVVTHPCDCHSCRVIRVYYVIGMSLIGAVHWGIGTVFSALVAPETGNAGMAATGAILRTAGAAYWLGALGCIVYFVANGRRRQNRSACSRLRASD